MRKMNVQTVAIEVLARECELDKEAKAVETRCSGSVEFQAWRFSFFSSPVNLELLPYINDTDYLGYAIFIDMKLPNGKHARYVYESVVVEPSFHGVDTPPFGSALPAHYIHCVRKYTGWVGKENKHRFGLSGSFFCQQNNLTHVCAHAALRWLLNNLPERAEAVISYEAINQDLQIDHTTNKVGQYGDEPDNGGLPMDDLLRVLDIRNYKYLDVDYETPIGNPQPYWRFIYSIIESGYPALVFFKGQRSRHVICAIGHTLNTDIWDAEAELAYSGAPRAKHLSTASWVDHFIIHDDNYGMYFSMTSKALSPAMNDGGPFQVTGVLGIVPANIELYPMAAEIMASVVLSNVLGENFLKDCYWLRALRQEEAAPGKWVVLRTLFTSKAMYKQHLNDIEDVEGNALTKREIDAIIAGQSPDHFWMTEIMMSDVYTANKRKVGEILFALEEPQDAAASYTDSVFSGCIAIRLPGNIIVPDVGLEEIGLDFRETKLIGHVPLLRTSCPVPPFEW